ncbi:4-oxalocrotonate tautomerase family protein [Pseudomonas sp. GD04087]|uniref:tautomerase family protein n=1 Tax=Pseudomonas TaxID=286 RepID=UPI001F42F25C|nr:MULTISPECIES: 4-oxalocrotonate tautomerase family protein [Pseudomonas]MDH0292848.1 4-oxalocrotonate tautomerase family protein [Pseudomonas sp. GD04087]MDH1052791.1 4-oxalocrotonate tautomerase family protein [Pseudomonas sp. GD03903]MDH2003019.1 4-oxalocrotonate tautomerase family protein [Pseudomonas sp. GD03691]
MPFVSLRITRGATERQKQDIIREFTQTLERVLHKDPAWTHIVIDEVDPADWGHAGLSVKQHEQCNQGG